MATRTVIIESRPPTRLEKPLFMALKTISMSLVMRLMKSPMPRLSKDPIERVWTCANESSRRRYTMLLERRVIRMPDARIGNPGSHDRRQHDFHPIDEIGQVLG